MHLSKLRSRHDDAAHVELRIRRSGQVTEFHVCARPSAGLAKTADIRAQARATMRAVAEVLDRYDAAMLHERVFLPADTEDEAAAALDEARSAAGSRFDDGVSPTRLLVPGEAFVGVQVHAVAGCGQPKALSVEGRPCGRMLDFGSWRYLSGGDLQAGGDGSPAEQAAGMLAQAEALLEQAGGSLRDVARTWMWLGSILDWYGEFNRVRNELFAARGMLMPDARGSMPASTGIGIGPAGRRCCTMDLAATLGEARPEFLLTASRQNAASKYGSAFSRAAAARTPAGRTIYVSGTAAIDAAGRTMHVGDAEGQIQDTLRNLWAVLADAGGRREDVVQAMVYCKTPQVEAIFRRHWSDLGVPYVLAVADVCRDDLLFEVEVTAMAAVRSRKQLCD